MKILYVTDLHGDYKKYKKVLDIAKNDHYDVVVNGGDMLPKCAGDMHKIQSNFLSWLATSHFPKYKENKIFYLGMLGNDDLMVFDSDFCSLEGRNQYFKDLSQSKVTVGGIDFIGCNYVTDYPFRLKDRCLRDTKESPMCPQYGGGLYSEVDGSFYNIEDWPEAIKKIPTLKQKLDSLPVSASDKVIYVIHNPPTGCGLDVLRDGSSVGSKSVSDFIMRKQPLYSLHGHVHESPDVSGKFYAYLDNTVSIQPGQLGLSHLSYVRIDIGRENHKEHKFDAYVVPV